MTNKATVFLAWLDTRNFSFRAVASTEAKARKAIEKGWNRHRKQFSGVGSFSEFADSVTVEPLQLGECYRDGEQIV